MPTIDTVVIGGGHAGLAVSRLLTAEQRDHVILERGRIGERWRTERWDSLHLLTPNWMMRLPAWGYRGPEPDAYMGAPAFVRHLERYAASFGAPILGGTTVEAVCSAANGYLIMTPGGIWHARHVVVATGPHGVPRVPATLDAIDGVDHVVTSASYRSPDRLPRGGVLVVGASSSGVQIADELNRAGREVVLSVGGHTRVPRLYRGVDIFWWLESTGRLARTIEEVRDPAAARRERSLQLVGRNGTERTDVDLPALQARGVRLAGRLERAAGSVVTFRDDLQDTTVTADRRMHHLLDAVDEYVARTGLTDEVWPASRPQPLHLPAPLARLDLAGEGISTVVLAAGYRPDHSWLRLPVLNADGSIRQRRGITEAPGVYVVGQRFQHRRDSGFIDGARYDARAVVGHLIGTSARKDEPAEESTP